jgi:hypothetical protein
VDIGATAEMDKEMVEYIKEALELLILLCLIVLTAGVTGYLLIRKQRFYSYIEKTVFSIALGLGLWALLFFAMGLLGLLYRDLIWFLTLAGAFGATLYIIRSNNLLLKIRQWKKNYKPRIGQIIYIPVVLYLGLLLWVTAYPPVSWDSTMYHLVLARQYLNEHHIVINTGITFPVLPALNHMLFTWAFALKGHLLAQLVECALLILTAIGLYSWGKRRNQPAFGMAVSAFWLAHPMVLWLGRTAFVDIGLTAFVFLGIYALHLFWDHHETHWWYIGIAMLSFSAGIKMPGLLFLSLGAAVGFYTCLKSLITWRILANGYILAFFIVAPWYGFIAYHTGNPVWPMFYQYSRGVWASPSISTTFGWIFKLGIPKTLTNFILLPFHLIYHPERFLPADNQTLFFLTIAWPLAWIISWFSRSVRWWTLWALAFSAYWFLTSQQLRFWIVILPIVGLALYESIQLLVERFFKTLSSQQIIWLTIATVVFLFSLQTTFSQIKAMGYPSMTPKSQEEFLVNNFVGYKAVNYINRNSSENDAVYVINGSWLNYYFRPRVIDMTGMLQGSFRPVFPWPNDREWMEYIKSQNVTWILVNYVYVPPLYNIKEGDAEGYPRWPDYPLVYADTTTWVFRHSSSVN